MKKKKILVHVCCAPCSTYSFQKLYEDDIEPVGFFYNPNIHPQEEYSRRLNEAVSFYKEKDYSLEIKEASSQIWFNAVKGLENEPEGGKRCEVCFELRMEQTAIFAKENGYDGFSTVLTISPHKNSDLINKIGKELAEKHQIAFLEENFKKNDGFKKSLEISKQYNLYRQNYCGCIFSQR
jgi:predicted adenine nucleotide alpha hydrolase (AANH) superfamily ATPase